MIENTATNKIGASNILASNSDQVIPRYYIKTGRLTKAIVKQMIEVDHIPLHKDIETDYQARFELEGYMNEVNNLIKDEDWFNIPAPIREACDGVITMTERLA